MISVLGLSWFDVNQSAPDERAVRIQTKYIVRFIYESDDNACHGLSVYGLGGNNLRDVLRLNRFLN